jgi:hypothetical protein
MANVTYLVVPRRQTDPVYKGGEVVASKFFDSPVCEETLLILGNT